MRKHFVVHKQKLASFFVSPKKQVKQNQNKNLELLIEALLHFLFVDDKI